MEEMRAQAREMFLASPGGKEYAEKLDKGEELVDVLLQAASNERFTLDSRIRLLKMVYFAKCAVLADESRKKLHEASEKLK